MQSALLPAGQNVLPLLHIQLRLSTLSSAKQVRPANLAAQNAVLLRISGSVEKKSNLMLVQNIFFFQKPQNSRKTNLLTVQQDATYSVYYISVGSYACFGC